MDSLEELPTNEVKLDDEKMDILRSYIGAPGSKHFQSKEDKNPKEKSVLKQTVIITTILVAILNPITQNFIKGTGFIGENSFMAFVLSVLLFFVCALLTNYFLA